jgi:alkylation response protein AidB-like acyl-CoA dehydrogenase
MTALLERPATTLDLGDPWDDRQPLSYKAVLAADERGELLAAGERALDAYGLAAEYVPVHLGGRLDSVERLAGVLRAVYRRDPCLGLGHGASALMAAANVWTAGSPAQQRATAELLLANGKLACAYHELAHGNDLGRAEFAATADGDRLRLTGRKEVVANLARADAMVLFARTGPNAGRAHSPLLVHRSDLPAGAVRDLPRFRTAGMRGVPLGGIELTDAPVGADTVLGRPGHGLEIALRSFQLTRVVVPGMVLGILDAALAVAVRWSTGRRLYGGTAADLPRTRAVLADAYADLLACDAFCRVAARAVHVTPASTVLYASALKYLVPKVVIAAVTRLSDLLGAGFYLRDGESALMQKLVRDVRPASFGHAGAASCLLAVLPQLPGLARRAWPDPEPEPALFAPTAAPLDLGRLGLSPGGRDPLAAAADPAELAALATACRELPPHELGTMASAGAYELAARYARLLGTAAVRGTGGPWAGAALARLAGRPVPAHLRDDLHADLAARSGTPAWGLE